MSERFDPILKALRSLAAAGAGGFEGLVRDCLENLSNGQRIYRAKSGPQAGGDMFSEELAGFPNLAVEAKRFGAKTRLPLDELKQKLFEATDDTLVDIWALALSKEMVEPDYSQLRSIAAKKGVLIVVLDWRKSEGSLPVLAALVASSREIVGKRLKGVDDRLLEEVASHPSYETITDRLRRDLTAPEVGFDLASAAASTWLFEATSDLGSARAKLNGHLDVSSPSTNFVERKQSEGQLNHWWQEGAAQIAVVLGGEGSGKSWFSIRWAIRLSRMSDSAFPMVLAISAKNLSAMSAAMIIATALKAVIPSVPLTQLHSRVERWIRGGDCRILLVIDGLNEHRTVDWLAVVESFSVDPLRGRVSLLVTSRDVFWKRDVIGREPEPEIEARVVVGEYTDAELNQFLKPYDVKSGDIAPALLALIRTPRLATLAMAVREELGDRAGLTPADVLLADWKSRLRERRRGLENVEFSELVAGFGRAVLSDAGRVFSTKEIHGNLANNSGRDLMSYHQVISEIVDHSWLEPAEKPDQFRVSERHLPYAIGLDIVLQLERTGDRGIATEIIALSVDDLRGSDAAVGIIRAASTILVARRKASWPVQLALLRYWLQMQNIGGSDFKEFGRRSSEILACSPPLPRRCSRRFQETAMLPNLSSKDSPEPATTPTSKP